MPFIAIAGSFRRCAVASRLPCLLLEPGALEDLVTSRCLKHRQFPCSTGLITPQDVQIGIITSELHVAVVMAVPLVKQLGDLDLLSVERKLVGNDAAVRSRNGFHLNKHRMPPHLTPINQPL